MYQLQSGAGWRVMDEPSSLQKVLWALKNAEIKACSLTYAALPKRKWAMEPVGRPLKAKKLKLVGMTPQARPSSQTPKRTPKPTPKASANSTSKPAESPSDTVRTKPLWKPKVHEAKSGATPIPDYTLNLISFMCNQSYPEDALVALDTPLETNDGTNVDESDSERQIRLQLRHRYIAAMSIGISPLTFSRRLMQLWGGTVLSSTVAKARVPPPQSASPELQEMDEDRPEGPLITPSNAPVSTTTSYWDEENEKPGEPVDVPPGAMDVLLGRGGGANNWEGNRRFREKVTEWKPLYEETVMGAKHSVAKRLVQSWRDEGGRFLERIKPTLGAGSIIDHHLWTLVSNARAYKKTFQALRSKPEAVWNGPSTPQLSSRRSIVSADVLDPNDDFMAEIDEYDLSE